MVGLCNLIFSTNWRMLNVGLSSVSLSLLLFSIGNVAAQAGDRLEGVQLQWKATTDMSDISKINLNALAPYKFKIESFKDTREIIPKGKIGENLENPDQKLPVTTKAESIGEFVTDHVRDILRKAGIDITSDKADYIITGEIRDFFVTETNRYAGSVVIKYTVKKGNKVVWSGAGVGTNFRFGRSYKLDNYMESLSDSLLESVRLLLDNQEFRDLFKKR